MNYFSDISSSKAGALGSAPTNSGGLSVLLCADGVFLLDFTCMMKTDRKLNVIKYRKKLMGFGNKKNSHTFQKSSNMAAMMGRKRSEKRLLCTTTGKVMRLGVSADKVDCDWLEGKVLINFL